MFQLESLPKSLFLKFFEQQKSVSLLNWNQFSEKNDFSTKIPYSYGPKIPARNVSEITPFMDWKPCRNSHLEPFRTGISGQKTVVVFQFSPKHLRTWNSICRRAETVRSSVRVCRSMCAYVWPSRMDKCPARRSRGQDLLGIVGLISVNYNDLTVIPHWNHG